MDFSEFLWVYLAVFGPSPVLRERVGERALKTGSNINKYRLLCKKMKSVLMNNVSSVANTLSPTLSRGTGEGAEYGRFIERG